MEARRRPLASDARLASSDHGNMADDDGSELQDAASGHLRDSGSGRPAGEGRCERVMPLPVIFHCHLCRHVHCQPCWHATCFTYASLMLCLPIFFALSLGFTGNGLDAGRRGLPHSKEEYKRHAYASNHALFTGRAWKSNTAAVNRQRKWGIMITGALVLFVYASSYGLGQVRATLCHCINGHYM